MSSFKEVMKSSPALKSNMTNVLTLTIPYHPNDPPSEAEIGRPSITKVMQAHNLIHKALVLLETGDTREKEHTIVSGIKFHLTMKNMIDRNDPRIKLVADAFDHEWFLQTDNDALFEVVGTTSWKSEDIRILSRRFRHEHPTFDEGVANCVGYVDYLAARILDRPPSTARTYVRRLWTHFKLRFDRSQYELMEDR